MKNLFIFLLLFLSQQFQAQSMQIGLLNSKKLDAFTISIRQGKYLLECDGQKFGEYRKNNIFLVRREGKMLEVRDKRNLIGHFSELKLIHSSKESIVTIKGVSPSTQSHEYDETIKCSVVGDRLQVINAVNLEKYISGVIEAEGGINAALEYYKAQAVLIRTFTIKNIYKHAEEGFNLCDEVHCQAYHGRSARNEAIYIATRTTAGEVVMDKDSILIMSPFHSSCGGQTSNSGIYWQTDLSYLQGVKDPFCVSMRNYNWQKEVSIMEWFAFLNEKGVSNPDKHTNYALQDRKKYFIGSPNLVTYRQVREKFGLRSTYFSVERDVDQVIIKGHGYGHGIGMCQIGAMEMAQMGYTYLDIIHFYFQQVTLTDYRKMELHRY